MDETLVPDPGTIAGARRGHFLLESGFHGDLWLDLDRLLLDPVAISPHVQMLANRLAIYDIEVVCGPATGGALVARWIAAELGVAYARTERMIDQVKPDSSVVAYHLSAGARSGVAGKRLAIVDDAINTGYAVRGSLAALRAVGAYPVAVGTLISLGQYAREGRFDGLPLEHVVSISSIVSAPADCPMCQENMSLEDLVAPGMARETRSRPRTALTT